MNNPEILPKDRQLDVSVAMFFDEVVESLSSYYEQHGTFVDETIAEKNPWLTRYVNTLSRTMLWECLKDEVPTRAEEVAAFRVAYEAFFFAYKACKCVLPDSKPRVYAKGYFKGKSVLELREKIVGGGQNYLQHREHIGNLINRFMSELDPTVAYPQIAEAIASMTFNHIENGERERYIAQQVAAYAIQLNVE